MAKVKKVFAMDGVDCANCAAKKEEAVRGIDGVDYVSISFMAQRMTIEAEESELDKIMKKAQKLCRKVDPDCSIEF